MKNNYLRNITLVELPLNKEVIIMYPENVYVKLDNLAVDLGAICYKHRNKRTRGNKILYKPILVDKSSHVSRRKIVVRDFLQYISTQIEHKTLRESTLLFHATHFVEFFDWIDNNAKSDDVLTSRYS